MLTSDMCLAYKNNIKNFKCMKQGINNMWAVNMHDCQMTFKHDGFDLDLLEVAAEGGCCAWTKWVYMDGFGNVPKDTKGICGVPSSKRHGKDFK